MLDEQISRQLFEKNAIIDRIIFIGGFQPEQDVPLEVRDFLEEAESEMLKQYFGMSEDMVQNRDSDEMWEWLWDNQFFGFLVKFERFLMTWNDAGTAAQVHNSVRRVLWTYNEDIYTAISEGIQWAHQSYEESKKSPGVMA